MPAGDENQDRTGFEAFFEFWKGSGGFLSGGSESSLHVIGGVESLGPGVDGGFGVLFPLSSCCPTFFINKFFFKKITKKFFWELIL